MEKSIEDWLRLKYACEQVFGVDGEVIENFKVLDVDENDKIKEKCFEWGIELKVDYVDSGMIEKFEDAGSCRVIEWNVSRFGIEGELLNLELRVELK